jgi:hypothetical protein
VGQLSPAEAAVVAAAVQAVRAGRAFWARDRACLNRRDKSLDQWLENRGDRALGEAANCEAELQLAEAVDALERETGPVVP